MESNNSQLLTQEANNTQDVFDQLDTLNDDAQIDWDNMSDADPEDYDVAATGDVPSLAQTAEEDETEGNCCSFRGEIL
jgi:hypothetical protein